MNNLKRRGPGRPRGPATQLSREARELDDRSVLAGYITKAELANSIGCTEKTIQRYMNRPDGVPHLRIAGRVYFRVEAVRSWLEALEHQPNPGQYEKPSAPRKFSFE